MPKRSYSLEELRLNKIQTEQFLAPQDTMLAGVRARAAPHLMPPALNSSAPALPHAAFAGRSLCLLPAACCLLPAVLASRPPSATHPSH